MPDHNVIDLRSDLVSRPTPAMVREMARAMEEPSAFGLREDPRQQALEARLALMLDKEDALLFPTCTMANQVAIRLFCAPGETVLAEAESHVITSEAGAPAAISGAMLRPLTGRAGQVDLTVLEAALGAVPDALRSRVALIVLENTHNRAGGVPLPLEYHAEATRLAERFGTPIHLDGARLFNAAVALGCRPAEIARHATSVAVSLNKGLCAPLGAMLAGPRAFVAEALRVRQMLGGGIRPTGFLAAAGQIALDTMIDRLAEDHRHARRLAEGLAALPLPGLDPSVHTNIVVVPTTGLPVGPRELADALAARGILVLPFGPAQVRLCLHRDVGPREIDRVLEAFGDALAALRGRGGSSGEGAMEGDPPG